MANLQTIFLLLRFCSLTHGIVVWKRPSDVRGTSVHPQAQKTLPLLHPLRKASSSYTGYLYGKGMRKKKLDEIIEPAQSIVASVSNASHTHVGKPSSKRVLACVGESSTFALGLRLQRDLGPKWDVQLYWEGCASAFLTPQHDTPCGGQPYRQTVGFSSALLSAAEFVVILLGTSDASRKTSDDFDEQGFIWGYQNLVMDFQRMPTNPKVVILSTPPLYPERNVTGNPNMTVVNEVYPRIFPRIAATTNAQYVDGFNACGGHSLSCPNCVSESGQLSKLGACHLAHLLEETVLGLAGVGECPDNTTLH